MALTVYNTMHRRKEPFEPLDPPNVSVYVCGPTVYGHSHVGHAKSYISFDVIVRWLRASGYNVRYVQNITDVGHLTDDADEGEDKIVEEARRRGLHPMAVAELFTQSYLEDMDTLGVRRPDIMPRASGHIPEQLELIKLLVHSGHAYEVNGSVYFAVATSSGYGRLSGRVLDEVQAGARVAIVDEKRDARDFALWKAASPEHIMQWPSPWGMGFPGWHLECSAMSMKYLGETLDIHGGGLENQFPHHECEIAQSESATGVPFVRYWLHNHMITVGGEKMGKSKGNFILLKDILHPDWPVHDFLGRKYDPLVLRAYILNSHYRSDLDFSVEGLDAAEAGLKRLHTAVRLLRRALGSAGEGEEHGIDLAAVEEAFTAAMDDDFNTPQALAVLFDLARQSNTLVESGRRVSQAALAEVDGVFGRLGGEVLGLIPRLWYTQAPSAGLAARDAKAFPGSAGTSVSLQPETASPLVDGLVALLVESRKTARKDRDFARADAIRDQLAAIGVMLEDRPDGTTWRIEG